MWYFPQFDTPLCFVNQQELEEIRKCGMKNFRNIQVDEANLLTWQGLIGPVSIEHFHFLSDYSFRWYAAAGLILVLLSRLIVWVAHRCTDVGCDSRGTGRVGYSVAAIE
jgi:hypothetical protein